MTGESWRCYVSIARHRVEAVYRGRTPTNKGLLCKDTFHSKLLGTESSYITSPTSQHSIANLDSQDAYHHIRTRCRDGHGCSCPECYIIWYLCQHYQKCNPAWRCFSPDNNHCFGGNTGIRVSKATNGYTFKTVLTRSFRYAGSIIGANACETTMALSCVADSYQCSLLEGVEVNAQPNPNRDNPLTTPSSPSPKAPTSTK